MNFVRAGLSVELRRILAVIAIGLILGISFQAALEGVLIGLLAYLFLSVRSVRRIFRWVDSGMRSAPPDTDGVWGEISDALNRQKRRHRRTKKKMSNTITRTMRMTEVLDQGLLVLDANNSLDWWNRAATKMLGLRPEDRGNAIVNLIRDPDFLNFISSSFVDPLELSSTTHEGRTLEFSGSYFGKGEVVLIVTDITRITSVERLRREFVANVSHELRTPLTVIKGYVETIKDASEVPSRLATAFDSISEQAAKMQNLAEDLLVLSELESEPQPKNLEPLQLHTLLIAVVGDAELLSEGRHHFEIDCDNEIMLYVDEKEMRSMVGNIVINAVQHNPEGAHIQIQVRDEEEDWEIVVIDDGIGMELSEIPRITERFYRVDSSRHSISGGTGLGLAIVKHTLNRYGGSLIIHSIPGEGAEFRCRLPKQHLHQGH